VSDFDTSVGPWVPPGTYLSSVPTLVERGQQILTPPKALSIVTFVPYLPRQLGMSFPSCALPNASG
jgi:hypothetical protein